MIKNRFFKETLGIKAELVIAQALDTSGASSAPQGTFELFVANGVAGALGVFWSDTHAALAAGDTALAANIGRKFFYGYKLADGSVKTTTGIPCKPKYKSAAYNAGTADTFTLTVAGTISTGQNIIVRIQDITGGMIPYPVYTYTVPYNTSNNQTAADIAAAINAEVDEKILSATAATNVVTIVAADKTRNIKVLLPQLATTTAAPTDASVFTVAQTVKGVLPLGTNADMVEFERIWKLNIGGIEYSPEGTKPSEFGVLSSNVLGNINYGFLVVTGFRREDSQGSVHSVTRTTYTIVAIATANLATLAAY